MENNMMDLIDTFSIGDISGEREEHSLGGEQSDTLLVSPYSFMKALCDYALERPSDKSVLNYFTTNYSWLSKNYYEILDAAEYKEEIDDFVLEHIELGWSAKAYYFNSILNLVDIGMVEPILAYPESSVPYIPGVGYCLPLFNDTVLKGKCKEMMLPVEVEGASVRYLVKRISILFTKKRMKLIGNNRQLCDAMPGNFLDLAHTVARVDEGTNEYSKAVENYVREIYDGGDTTPFRRFFSVVKKIVRTKNTVAGKSEASGVAKIFSTFSLSNCGVSSTEVLSLIIGANLLNYAYNFVIVSNDDLIHGSVSSVILKRLIVETLELGFRSDLRTVVLKYSKLPGKVEHEGQKFTKSDYFPILVRSCLDRGISLKLVISAFTNMNTMNRFVFLYNYKIIKPGKMLILADVAMTPGDGMIPLFTSEFFERFAGFGISLQEKLVNVVFAEDSFSAYQNLLRDFERFSFDMKAPIRKQLSKKELKESSKFDNLQSIETYLDSFFIDTSFSYVDGDSRDEEQPSDVLPSVSESESEDSGVYGSLPNPTWDDHFDDEMMPPRGDDVLENTPGVSQEESPVISPVVEASDDVREEGNPFDRM
jgi:hypothetical protein